jgi:hypothetical protein
MLYKHTSSSWAKICSGHFNPPTESKYTAHQMFFTSYSDIYSTLNIPAIEFMFLIVCGESWLIWCQRGNHGLLIRMCRHTVILRHLYYIIDLLKTSLPHQMVCYFKVRASVYHGGILWCGCIETDVTSEVAIWFLHLDQGKKKNWLKHCFMVQIVLLSCRCL